MGVTKNGTLFYDPEFIEEVGVHKASGVLLHEVQHLLRHHHARAERFYPEHENLWAAAIDMEINDDLEATGVELPENGTFARMHELPNNKLAEWYYRELEQSATKIEVSCACGHSKVKGEEKDEEGDGEGEMRLQMKVEHAAQEVLKNIEERMEHPENFPGRSCGDIPGGLKKLVDINRGKLDWRALLRRYIGRAFSTHGAVDYTYRKLSRRQGLNYGAGNPIHAGLHSPKLKVCVALDTSGSMEGGPMAAALGELDKILSAVNCQIWFITGDAQVEEQKNIRDINVAKAMVRGYGGTDFRPSFEAAERQKPDLFIYLTDGYGPAPAKAPPFEVIWCITPSGKRPVEWGREVNIEGEDENNEEDY